MTSRSIWFVSDTHLSHANIIKYCSRPFETVEDMNETLVANWNAVVRPNDYVVHCGDVMMGRLEDAIPYVERLNGRKLLLRGNHDTKNRVAMLRSLGWLVFEGLIVNDTLVQHHYVEDEATLADYEIVVHGHAHGGQKGRRKHFDVGVDALAVGNIPQMYGPISAVYVLSRSDEYTLHMTLHNLFE